MREAERECLAAWRTDLLGELSGAVLEVGAGTGANLAHYPDAVDRLVLCEPDAAMRRRIDRSDPRVELSDASAERLPFDDASFDAVVCTLVLCSVTDPAAAIAEVARVLAPGGRFVFLEHVAAEGNPGRLAWQRRIEPVWKRLMGNCHLTRPTADLIEAGGLVLSRVERESMRKAMPIVRPTVRGVARKPVSAS
jgi:ubiquinone/menaquinone biosynthesis C-methylase UbiE